MREGERRPLELSVLGALRRRPSIDGDVSGFCKRGKGRVTSTWLAEGVCSGKREKMDTGRRRGNGIIETFVWDCLEKNSESVSFGSHEQEMRRRSRVGVGERGRVSAASASATGTG